LSYYPKLAILPQVLFLVTVAITEHNFETRHPSDDSSLVSIGLVLSEEKIFEKVYDV
jgi:hypothetical protein